MPKKDLRTVATTTKKIQEPNHAAATLLVSGSPAFHLLNTLIAPIIPTTAPMAYIRLVPVSKYPFTLLVASWIPAFPSCAKRATLPSVLDTKRIPEIKQHLTTRFRLTIFVEFFIIILIFIV